MMLVLFLPSLFYKSLFRKVLDAIKNNSTTKILFAQNIEIVEAILEMPKVMWQLALVYLFQWYALFCYWQNASKSIGLSVWNATPSTNPELYEQAVSWTGLVNGWYNVVTFLSAFALVYFVKKSSAKMVHFACLLLAATGFLLFPFIENKYLLFPAITGFGIGWASMMGIPYLLVVGNIPKERYGVYMGIINMMIVVPMILQTVTFGYVLKNFLGNNSSYAVLFAGVLLVLAALATLLIKAKPTDQEVQLTSSGH
jgi:maltose/moltooligosaccharide transporter